MHILIKILMILLLIGTIYQDFKTRSISWYLLAMLAAVFILNALKYHETNVMIRYVFYNIGITTIMLAAVSVYFKLKYRQGLNLINKQLGFGDILILYILCLGFSPLNFVAFLLMAFLLTLIIHITGSIITRRKSRTIPLAGYLSVFYLSISLIAWFINGFDLIGDSRIENLILLFQ